MPNRNDNTLTQREFIIIGGRRGTAVLNTAERVLQTYSPQTAEGDIEDLVSTEVADRAPINQERHSAVIWAEGPENGEGAVIRLHGGANESNGILVSNERSNGGVGAVPWTIMNEILIPEYYPLMKMAATPVPGVGFVLAGGLHLLDSVRYPGPFFMLFSGGLMLGAVYMATDMVTSPTTSRGSWIFGIGIGFLVVVIRIWGGLPEGVMYAILLMNAFVPFINRATQPRVFGTKLKQVVS